MVNSPDRFFTIQVYYSAKYVLGELNRFVWDAMIVRWGNGFIMSAGREDNIYEEQCIHIYARKTVCVCV